jgi:hypothetical protein
VARGRQMVQKGFNFCRPHLLGMAFSMEQNELPGPVAIGSLRAAAEMAPPANDGDLVEKAGAASGVVTP